MSESPWRIRGDESADRWLVTTAIGGEYFAKWERAASANWMRYAEHHGLGIAVAVGDMHEDGEPELNGAWQKLLALRSLRHHLGRDVRCAIIDTDLFINPGSPDVFDTVEPTSIGVVSQVRGIPRDLDRLNNRIAFFRQRFMKSDFPLDSLLNARPRQLFEWAGLNPSFDDYACTGLIVADTAAHAEMFAEWFRDAPFSKDYLALGDWEQTYLNHCLQQRPELQWLDYAWQALWIFEVAAYYPFLYSGQTPDDVAAWCFSASLLRNNFLHLAGGWESRFLSNENFSFPTCDDDVSQFAEELAAHENRRTAASMRGKIAPP